MKIKHFSCLPSEISGGKKHSVLKGAADLIRLIARIPEIKKIHPSRIDPGGSGKPRIRVVERQFGLRLKIIGNDGAQEFNVVTSNSIQAIEAIRKIAPTS